MVLQGEAIGYVALNAFGAMTKVALVAAVGFYFALYPKTDPYLSSSALKYISRISNLICLPAIIISSVGSGLSVSLLTRIFILILFSFFNGFISAMLASTLGKLIDKSSYSSVRTALFVATSCPNVVSLPLIVFQSLCAQPIVTADYEGNSAKCFTDSSTMIFEYSIGWHLMYWSYFSPLLEALTDIPIESSGEGITEGEYNNQNVPEFDTKIPFIRPSLARSRSSYYWSQSFIASFRNPTFGSQNRSFRNAFSDFESIISADKLKTFRGWCQTVLLSPVMVAIYIGIFIGLIEPLQKMLFFDSSSVLSPFGAAIITLGQPAVCLAILIMAASLAKVDLQWSEALASAQNTLDRWSTRVEDLLFNTHKYASVTSTSNTTTATANDIHSKLTDIDNAPSTQQVSNNSESSSSSSSTSMPSSSNHISIEMKSTTISPLHESSSSSLESNVIQNSFTNKNNDNDDDDDEENVKVTTTIEGIYSKELVEDTTTAQSFKTKDQLLPTQPTYKPTNGLMGSTKSIETIVVPDTVKRPHWRSIVSLFVCRMMLPGVFAILLIQLFIASGVISKSDKMLQMVIILVSCGPPAPIVIASLNQLELYRTAAAMAYLYLFTYIASILVMTVWATIAMSLIY